MAVILTAATCVGTYFIFFYSYETPASDFEYVVSDDGKYILVDYYIGDDKEVIVPQEIDDLPVRIISSLILKKAPQVESIVIPDGVEFIHYQSFYKCENLRSVNLGNNMKVILEHSFMYCPKLEKVELPSGLTEIYPHSFSRCESLKEITLPDSLESVKKGVFSKSPISKVNFEEGTKSICSYACYWIGDTLESVTIPDTVEEMGKNCFGCYLKEIHFEGDAPKFTSDQPFDKNTVVYYDKDTSGWDTPILSEYTLIAE